MRTKVFNHPFIDIIVYMFVFSCFSFIGADRTVEVYEEKLKKYEKGILFNINYKLIMMNLEKIHLPDLSITNKSIPFILSVERPAIKEKKRSIIPIQEQQKEDTSKIEQKVFIIPRKKDYKIIAIPDK